MHRVFAFWWLCARTAFWGNSSAANDWQWIFASPLWQSIGSAIGGALGAFISAHWMEAPLMSPDTPMGVFLGGLFGFCATWLAFFLVRFLKTPSTLYYEQKDRADKLEGIASTAILSKRRKPIAVLHARYIRNKAPNLRQALDYEADSLQSIQDLQVIFSGLTVETQDMTRLMHKNNKKINFAKDPQKKRQAVKNLADHLNIYSDRVEEFAAIIRGMTPIMLECTSRYLERMAPNANRATLNSFIGALGGAVASIEKNVESAGSASANISANFTGVTHDLNTAVSRLETVIEAYKAGLNEYLSACEQISKLANEKFDNGKTKLAEASI
ncbi:hypothetical protein [Bradyrhizobium lablabi]|uniref:hypothetical protein n=1 Tax=Bradyrhizobium lablabi TaxID=722472 RepID=UPI00090C196F|nr:hypothetical protein [Bradyrhizobium lablabi]SHK94545.1 hypothetical protein SAMN05444321_1235 [Bradyrhizobium lablabi]